MIASWAGKRRTRAASALVLAAGLVACASPMSMEREELLEQFRAGRVRLDCDRCRYDFRGAEWMLEDGHYEPLALAILRSGDGSGRSWYLLGRVAEATERPELAIHYYRESLATARQPIVALWPLYEDVNYRMRRLMSQAAEPVASARRESPPVEKVNIESLVVGSRPGSVGAFMAKLHRGDPVEVLDRSGDWEQVRLADGRVGWVWDAYTSASGEPPAPKRKAAQPRPRKPVAKQSSPRRAQQKPVASQPAASPPVAQKGAAIARTASGTAGILACPLPPGASLSVRSHGSDGVDDHPTETYAIEAPAREIVGFYEREMERAGWHKASVSSEFLLYFVKDDETVGVLIDREGGFFTLMGS